MSQSDLLNPPLAIPEAGTRVRLTVEDAFLRDYRRAARGAYGTVVDHPDCDSPRSVLVRFDHAAEPVWVGCDEIAPLTSAELSLSCDDIFDADKRTRDTRVASLATTQAPRGIDGLFFL